MAITKLDRFRYMNAYCDVRKGTLTTVHSKGDGHVIVEGVTDRFIASHKDKCLDFLIEKDIRKSWCVNGRAYYGYSELDKMWYAWSIGDRLVSRTYRKGSKVQTFNDAFRPNNKEEYEKRALSFWRKRSGRTYDEIRLEPLDDKGFNIVCRFASDVPNVDVRGKEVNHYYQYPQEYGRGEWEALTDEDAKEMARDYCVNVSKPMFSIL